MYHKSWVFEFVIELVYFIGSILFFLIFAYAVYGNIIYSFFVASVVPLRFWYSIFIQHKPLGSKLCKLPLLKYNGIIKSKHIYGFWGSCFFQEYIIFIDADNNQIKLYIPSLGRERRHLYTFNVGDVGTIHFRKGKKYNYFEEFEKFESDAEDCPDLT